MLTALAPSLSLLLLLASLHAVVSWKLEAEVILMKIRERYDVTSPKRHHLLSCSSLFSNSLTCKVDLVEPIASIVQSCCFSSQNMLLASSLFIASDSRGPLN